MEFYTQFSEKRPVRLCQSTRSFACDSLNYKYGLETEKNHAVTLDHIEKSIFEEMNFTDEVKTVDEVVNFDIPVLENVEIPEEDKSLATFDTKEEAEEAKEEAKEE